MKKEKERVYGQWAVSLMATLVANGWAADEAFPIIRELSNKYGAAVITETTLRMVGIDLAEALTEGRTR